MRKTIVILVILAKSMVAYSQIQLGLELGANSIYGNNIRNEYFKLSPKLEFSPLNIGGFVSITKAKKQFIFGYRSNELNGIYKVKQYDALNSISMDIRYIYIVNRFYLGYMHKWKGFRLGGSLSYYQYYNGGYGVKRSIIGINAIWRVQTDFNAPTKNYLVPAFEASYDIKIRKRFMIIASLEVPLWRFSGYNIFYETNVNNTQNQSININPRFYAVFLNLRIPVFTIGSGWNYFSKYPKREIKEYNSGECPD